MAGERGVTVFQRDRGTMTAQEFEARTGYAPAQDDLDRVNCEEAGTVGHLCCGWCEKHDGPMFQCGCRAKDANKHA